MRGSVRCSSSKSEVRLDSDTSQRIDPPVQGSLDATKTACTHFQDLAPINRKINEVMEPHACMTPAGSNLDPFSSRSSVRVSLRNSSSKGASDQTPDSKDVQYSVYSADKARKYKNQQAQYKQVKVKVDSGAMVSVAPPSIFKEFITMPTYESEIGIGYTSACGTTIPDQGLKQPIIRTREAGVF